jgi:hypothetical protein
MKIHFFILISLIIFSCKKKDVDSPYVLERDDHDTAIEIVTSPTISNTPHSNCEIVYSKAGLPGVFTGIYGVIRSTKPWNGQAISPSWAFMEASDIPINYCPYCNSSNVKEFNCYADPLDPEKPVFEFSYNKKWYRVINKNGFSNCIVDTSINSVNYSNGYTDYHIKFDDVPKNTDEILTCNGINVPVKDTIIKLAACGSSANYNGKPKTFSLYYTNFEHFEIDGRFFVILKRVQMHHWTQW